MLRLWVSPGTSLGISGAALDNTQVADPNSYRLAVCVPEFCLCVSVVGTYFFIEL